MKKVKCENIEWETWHNNGDHNMIIGRTGDGEKYCQLDLYKQNG